MSADETPVIPRASRRVAVAAEVRLEFERFTGFLAEMAANLSEGGMFVRTRNLRPVGSRLRFEIGLSDQWPLVRGTGEVVWTRWRDGGEQEPAGMGIRFAQLDSQSRDLIGRVVEERRRAGWSPFDLDTAAPAAESELEPDNWFDLASRRDTDALVELPPSGDADRERDGSGTTSSGPALTEPVDPPAPAPPPVVATSFELGPLFPPDEPFAGEPSFEPPPSLPERRVPAEGSAALGSEPGMSEFRDWLEPRTPPAPAAVFAEWVPDQPSRVETGETWLAPPARRRAGALAAVLVAAALLGFGVWMLRTRQAPPGPRPADPAPPASAAAAAPAVEAPPAPATAIADGRQGRVADPEPAAAVPFTALERITWENVPSGTLVTLWLDGAVRPDAIRHSRLEAGGTRELLQIRGARRAFPGPRLDVGSPQLVRIRTGFHQRGGGDEQHVVLDLAGRTVRLLDLEVSGNQIRVSLGNG